MKIIRLEISDDFNFSRKEKKYLYRKLNALLREHGIMVSNFWGKFIADDQVVVEIKKGKLTDIVVIHNGEIPYNMSSQWHHIDSKPLSRMISEYITHFICSDRNLFKKGLRL